MKKLDMSGYEPVFCKAEIYIRSDYEWGSGWNGNSDARKAFKEEVKEKFPFGDFKNYVEGNGGLCDRLFNEKDKRQYIYCHPMEISFLGERKAFLALEENVKMNKFNTFFYVETGNIKDVYDLSKEQLTSILDKNEKLIRDNIQEVIKQNPGINAYKAMDTVFEYIRFPNTYDHSYFGFISSEELPCKKTREVFNKMVKNKEVLIDKDECLSLPVKKRSLKAKSKEAVSQNLEVDR